MSLVRIVAAKLRNPSTLEAVRSRLANRLAKGLDAGNERQRLIDYLSSRYPSGAAQQFSQELEESSFSRRYQECKRELGVRYLESVGTTSDFDCTSLYVLVRLARPSIVVETGVMLGAFSAHILEALERNGTGRLYSIDLPKAVDIGALVPAAARRRWNLILGDAKLILPRLLKELGQIDLFHHDSLHTYRHQRWEYNIATPFLASTGVLTSHDVIGVRGFRHAFKDHCHDQALQFGIFHNLGIAWPKEVVKK